MEPVMEQADFDRVIASWKKEENIWKERELALVARVAELEAECEGKGKLIAAQQNLRESLRADHTRYLAALEDIHAAAVEVALESIGMPEEDHLDTSWIINRTQAAINNEPMPD